MDKIKFNRKTWASGNTKVVLSIPSELIDYLGLENGSDVVLMPDQSKHGKFIAIWNKKEQRENKNDKKTKSEESLR